MKISTSIECKLEVSETNVKCILIFLDIKMNLIIIKLLGDK
jgi:hypothetical protein